MFLESPMLRAACDRCHKRKQRCMRPPTTDDNTPCRRCKDASQECVYSPPCRLGRPSNKSKQQRQRQGYKSHAQKEDLLINNSTPQVSPDFRPFNSGSTANNYSKVRIMGSKLRIQQPGPPQLSRNPPSTPPTNSPKSVVSAPDFSERSSPSIAPAMSPASSSNTSIRHLQDSTTSLQQTQSTQPQDPHQHINFPATMPSGSFLSTQDDRSVGSQAAKVDSYHPMWNMSIEDSFMIENGHTGGDTPQYHQQIALPDMLPTHLDFQHRPRKNIHSNKVFQVVDSTTLTSTGSSWSDAFADMQLYEQHQRPSLTPITPPPLQPASSTVPDGIHDESMNAGFVYMPSIDGYNPGSPWLVDVDEPYYTFNNDKSIENPITTTAILMQNYHLQMQLMATANLGIRGGEGESLRYPIYQG